MDYKYLLIIIIIFYLIFSKENKDNKENFQDFNEAYKNKINKRCHSIFGNYHPRCAPTSRLHHVGYFKYNTIKYPLIDYNVGNDHRRYVMLNRRLVKLNKKYWNKGYYFKTPFYYNKDVPFSFIRFNKYRGIAVNPATNRKFYVFGKRDHLMTYKYTLFREKDGVLQFSYKLPNRRRLSNGDPIFIRNQVSTYGPFIFYKD